MSIVSLRDLYVAELKDLFDVEQQILEELPAFARAATSSALRALIEEQLEATRVHVERVDRLLEKLGASRSATPCEALQGLVKDARSRIRDTERGDILDAALAGIVQRIEHYEIAAYASARTAATALCDHDAAKVLHQTLDEDGNTAARLTRIARQIIKQAAGEQDAYRPPTYLMTAVLMTEASGFASVPPRAHTDYTVPPAHTAPAYEVPPAHAAPPAADAAPEAESIENVTAHGDRGESADSAQRDAEVHPRDTEDPKSVEPRLERYPER